jgi:hypothetical protein
LKKQLDEKTAAEEKAKKNLLNVVAKVSNQELKTD